MRWIKLILFLGIIIFISWSINKIKLDNKLTINQIEAQSKKTDFLESHLSFTDYKFPKYIWCLGYKISERDTLTWRRIKSIYNYYRSRPDIIINCIENRDLVENQKKILKQLDLPTDLAYLRIIESSLKFYEQSQAGAKGVDQLMPNLAKKYGLIVDYSLGIDERLDSEKSGMAAAKFLKYLHKKFDNWFYVVAAYNISNTFTTIIKKSNGDNFFNIRKINRETYNFVPSFIVAKIIYENYDKMGFNKNQFNYYNYSSKIITIKSKKKIYLQMIADSINVKMNNLYIRNPSLIYNYIPKNFWFELKVRPDKYNQTIAFLKRQNIQIKNAVR